MASLISDRYGGYNNYLPNQRQLRWGHLIRNPKWIAERLGQTGALCQKPTRWARVVIRLGQQ